MQGLRLPEELRGYLAKPHGRLYRGKGIETVKKIEELRTLTPLICVGDYVTYYTLKVGYKPDIAVLDFKTVRDSFDTEKLHFIKKKIENYRVEKVNNPPAHITPELVKSLLRAVESLEDKQRTCIVVEGEEDLATIPLVYLLPHNSLVLYGQPGEGVVALRVNSEKKNIILDILNRMEKLESGDKVINLIKKHGIP